MRNNEQRDDQLIELGVASEETKGGEFQVLDSQLSLNKANGITED